MHIIKLAFEKAKGDKPDLYVISPFTSVVEGLKKEIRAVSYTHLYYKAFNHVAVLTYEKNLKNVENIINNLNLPVGLYVLRRTGKIGTVFDLSLIHIF